MEEPIFRLPPYRVEAVATALAGQVVDWGPQMFGVPDLLRQTAGRGVKVAVLDTGCSLVHEDLRDALLDAKDFTGSRYGAQDVQGHGTHCAGVVAARNNAVGMLGVAPECGLLIGKVLGDDGTGTSQGVAEGLVWAADAGADVISMSLGSGSGSPAILQAVRYAAAKGCCVVAAAGNSGPSLDTVNFPGKYEETIAVGSIDRNKVVSRFSSRGRQVDVLAPGDQVFSCYPPSIYAKLSGTSMATPFVAGVAALLVALMRQHDPAWRPTYTAVRQLIKETSTDAGQQGYDPDYGWGLINPRALLDAAAPPAPPQPPPADPNKPYLDFTVRIYGADADTRVEILPPKT